MKVAIVMGSKSDWGVMSAAVETLKDFGIENEVRIISAHRTPDLAADFARNAAANGIGVIIAGAGGAAHLGGVIAAMTNVPVIGVPIRTQTMGGLDSLLSIVQMAIDGAKNAALYAVAILALSDRELAAKLEEFRRKQTQKVLETTID